MSLTTLQLISELATQMGMYYSVATTGGTTTTLISDELTQYIHKNTNPLDWFVYGPFATADGANGGQERRTKAWTQDNATLTFWLAWPTGITASKRYDIFTRCSRARILAALNIAIRELGMYWQRPVEDTSLTTAVNTWTYTLPAGTNWFHIRDLELQVNTDASLTGYPYQSVRDRARIRETVSSTGTRAMVIQFDSLPVPSRTLRIIGDAYFSEISNDADVLPVTGPHEGAIHNWVYRRARMTLNDWLTEKAFSGDAETARIRALTLLAREAKDLKELLRKETPAQIVVPGQGTGQVMFSSPDVGYFGAFTPH